MLTIPGSECRLQNRLLVSPSKLNAAPRVHFSHFLGFGIVAYLFGIVALNHTTMTHICIWCKSAVATDVMDRTLYTPVCDPCGRRVRNWNSWISVLTYFLLWAPMCGWFISDPSSELLRSLHGHDHVYAIMVLLGMCGLAFDLAGGVSLFVSK